MVQCIIYSSEVSVFHSALTGQLVFSKALYHISVSVNFFRLPMIYLSISYLRTTLQGVILLSKYRLYHSFITGTKTSKMTSISLKSRFRLTLLNVSKHLTDDDVQKLLALTPDLTLNTKTNARNLFDALQDRKLLSEYQVELLIGWLDELQLSEASKCLKGYQCKHLQGMIFCFLFSVLPMI